MNILFLHASNIVTPAGSGIIRVTALLKEIFEAHGHKCFNAYRKEVDGDNTPLFEKSLKLRPKDEASQIVEACREWKIDVFISQLHPDKRNIALYRRMRELGGEDVKPLMVNCLHTRPYIETIGYDLSYLRFLIGKDSIPFALRIKKVLWGLGCMLLPSFTMRHIARRQQPIFDIMDRIVMLSRHFIPAIEQHQQVRPGTLHYANNPMVYSASVSAEDIVRKEKRVIFIGRLDEAQKRISRCLKIWAEIEKDCRFDDWTFDIIGSGDDSELYKRMSWRLGLKRVIFHGTQTPDEWYRKSSIMLMTSPSEGWGMVVLEAQRMGVVPVVYDSYESLHEFVTDGEDGLIITNSDQKEYVERLKSLMLDDEKRLKIQTTCANQEEVYTHDNIYKQWERILER